VKQRIATREQALKQGLTNFFPGTLCKRGHKAERNAKSGQCVECRREATRALAATGCFREWAAAAKVRAQEAEAAAHVTPKKRRKARRRGH